MFCLNCGKEADAGALFCTNCGKKLEEKPVVTQAEQEAAEAVENVTVSEPAVENVKADEPVINAEPVRQITDEPKNPYSYSAKREEPVPPFVPEAQVKEKTYFGTGALVFCLVVIGILSITTGVFAGLYFSVV